MVKNKNIDEIDLDGGLLCLNFVNSVPNRIDKPQPDYLSDIHLLIYWALRLKIIDNKIARQLHSEARRNSKRSKDFFREAIAFRELLYYIFQCICVRKKIPASDLVRLNKKISEYFIYLQLEQTSDGFRHKWVFDTKDFKQILAPIVRNSYETLLFSKRDRIKECPNCGWLFYDTSKNGKRRWCSMKNCGSNVKSLEWYYRNKEKTRS